MNKILTAYCKFCDNHQLEILMVCGFLIGYELAKRSSLRKREVVALEQIAKNLNMAQYIYVRNQNR